MQVSTHGLRPSPDTAGLIISPPQNGCKVLFAGEIAGGAQHAGIEAAQQAGAEAGERAVTTSYFKHPWTKR